MPAYRIEDEAFHLAVWEKTCKGFIYIGFVFMQPTVVSAKPTSPVIMHLGEILISQENNDTQMR